MVSENVFETPARVQRQLLLIQSLGDGAYAHVPDPSNGGLLIDMSHIGFNVPFKTLHSETDF
jgi:hypothetical protein